MTRSTWARKPSRSVTLAPVSVAPRVTGRSSSSVSVTRLLIVVFALGLLCRLAIFARPHEEGDEVVYRALAGQLRDGHGYTLMGTPLIGPYFPASQYGRPLFFHPPGGVVLFLLLYFVFGLPGFSIAQMLSYAAFFWSMIALFRELEPEAPDAATLGVAAVAALTPLMGHVTVHYWLEGPLLAFATAAAAVYVRAARRGSARLAALAGVLLGAATWMKVPGVLAIPGILLLGWAARDRDREPGAARRSPWMLAALFVGIAAVIQLPWDLWQWRVVGSAFPAWAGKPAPENVAGNAFVHLVTVVRSPWIYVTWIPRVIWTLVPSLVGVAMLRGDHRMRRIALALIAWITFVLGVHVALGMLGYSKVLRYVILITPASVALCGVVACAALRARGAGGAEARVAGAVLGLLLAGAALEIAQGTVSTFAQGDLITPLFMRLR
jgi:4-amino-4-deoxy-L-arabinose transferase-like glycosyltransferase